MPFSIPGNVQSKFPTSWEFFSIRRSSACLSRRSRRIVAIAAMTPGVLAQSSGFPWFPLNASRTIWVLFRIEASIEATLDWSVRIVCKSECVTMLLRSFSGISRREFASVQETPEFKAGPGIFPWGTDRRTEVPANCPSPRTSVNSLPSGGSSDIQTKPFRLMASEASHRLAAGGRISAFSVQEKASIERVRPSSYPSATRGYSTMTSLFFGVPPEGHSKSTWLTSRVSVASRMISSGLFIM